MVAGRYDGNWTAVVLRSLPGGLPGGAEQLIKARAKTLVVAPGLIERPYVFAGNDVPGVMLSTAARRLIRLYAVKPGERAVVLTANADGGSQTVNVPTSPSAVRALTVSTDGGPLDIGPR